ncbi:hypothetical protein [uncultured Helicobacter sp.]|uniref:hypothetical protein n=1 Tax=uncultured Helicobacter sp. TaxID=175537 RepID=UPI0026051E60|nr:hypothetical protein [uncultured Helicobacter sp.]
MKIYKLDNTKVAEAKHSNPLDCVFADGTFSFYVSESDEVLNTPFEEITKEDLPAEAIKQMKVSLESTKSKLLDEAKKIVSGITLFKSDVLGKEHWYDMQEQDQINLSQAREYLSLMPDAKVKIRCTDTSNVKDNVEHTKEQINKLFEDWFVSKSAILNAFSIFKIELENAITQGGAKMVFESFEGKIQR